MADGSIRIGTKLDTSGIKADIKELERELAKVRTEQEKAEAQADASRAKHKAEIDYDNQFPEEMSHREEIDNRAAKELDPIIEKQDSLNRKEEEYNRLLELANAKLEHQNAILQASKQLDDALKEDTVLSKVKSQEEYNSLLSDTQAKIAKIEELSEKFAKTNGVSKEEVLAANKEYEKLSHLLQELSTRKFDFSAHEAEVAKKESEALLSNASKSLNREISADNLAASIASQEQYNSLLEQTEAKMIAIEAHADRIAAATGVNKETLLQNNAAYQKLSDTMGMLKARAADFGDEAQEAGKKTTKAMKQAEKSTKKVSSETKRGIAGFGKMQLIMMGIMMAMRAISAATQEYMATNSKLEGQLNTLKSLWGQVLGPVIEWVINLLINAVSAVNAFVHALTGINFIARANEAALKKQAKAAGSASKAQLAGFDEQTKLSDTSGAGGDPVSLLEDSVNGIPEKLRELLEKGDFYGSGKYIAEQLSKGIEEFDWVGTGNKVGEILGNTIGFILGFALNIDPSTMLGAINGFVGGLLQGFANALQNVDWLDVGKNLLDLLLWGLALTSPGTAILSVLLSPNSDKLASGAAEFIGTVVAALLQAIVGAAARIGELATNLWTTIKGYFDDNVNWEGTPGEIIQGLWNGIIAALTGVKEWIKTNIWEPFVEGFVDCIDWDDPAMQVVVGLWEGIKEWFSNVKKWVNDNIWEPFKNAFKEAFGIHSPSVKMKEFGGDIISGLFAGITNGIAKIRLACQNIWLTIKGVFSSVGTWFQTTFSNAWQKVKDVFSKGGKIFDGIKEGISSTFKTIVNGLIDGINRVIRVPFNAINGMLNTIRSIKIVGIQPFANLWSYNPLSVPQIPKLALGGIVNRPGRGVPAIIGEAGKEAVLPLENHTEWMDVLADKISSGTITIPITLDGKRIATYIVDIQKKKAFAMNGV